MLNDVGNEGSSWSATAVDYRGRRLIFNAGLLEPERLSYRSGGYQVRCLQAFIARNRSILLRGNRFRTVRKDGWS
ncbi:hypothetical protein [Rikenella microfusus]|uniref:hypothetical protein n=1 Tax=Rikenella microfusus TaxID=28139 RepID=UPI003A9160BD